MEYDIRKVKLSFYNAIRARLAGKRKYVAVGKGSIRVFYSKSIDHARSRFNKGDWVIISTKELRKLI